MASRQRSHEDNPHPSLDAETHFSVTAADNQEFWEGLSKFCPSGSQLISRCNHGLVPGGVTLSKSLSLSEEQISQDQPTLRVGPKIRVTLSPIRCHPYKTHHHLASQILSFVLYTSGQIFSAWGPASDSHSGCTLVTLLSLASFSPISS